MTVATIHIGLGAIGRLICSTGVKAGLYRPVASADPAFAGRDLGDLCGLGANGVVIQASIADALKGRGRPKVALHATRSTVAAVADELIALVQAGCDVVSTCEELAAPGLHDAARVDEAAKEAGRRVVGAGVNPGFAMDFLPLALAQASSEIKSIAIRRAQDPLKRRPAFQKKVGVGRTREECERDIAAGQFGHVGLADSAEALAAGLGWRLVGVRESMRLVEGEDGRIKGVRQMLSARTDDGRRLRLQFWAVAGLARDTDVCRIEGTPPLRMVLPGGLSGDQATANLVLSAARRVDGAAPGLRVGADLPLTRAG